MKHVSHRVVVSLLLFASAAQAARADDWPTQSRFVASSLVSQRAFAGPYVPQRVVAEDNPDMRAVDLRLALSAGLAAFSAGFAAEGYVTLISPCDNYDRSVPFTRTCLSTSADPRYRQFAPDPVLRPGSTAAILGTVAAAGFATWFTVSLVERFGRRWTTSVWHLNSNHINKPLAVGRGTTSIGLNFGFGTVGLAGTF